MQSEALDVARRRGVLLWNGVKIPDPPSQDFIFSRIKAPYWAFDFDWLAKPGAGFFETSKLDIQPPSVTGAASVTRSGLGKYFASDALLKIDKETGYCGVALGHGVIKIPCDGIPRDPYPHTVMGKKDRSTGKPTSTTHYYAFRIVSDPYPENAAHAQVIIFEIVGNDAVPDDLEAIADLPPAVKKHFRKYFLMAMSTFAIDRNESPIAIHPDRFPAFTKEDPALRPERGFWVQLLDRLERICNPLIRRRISS